MNGAQHILEAFHRHNINTVFGYPGGCIMPLYDALVDDVGVEHVLCRHEQACALSADGYARASGEIGVCIATSGPGATNLITGVANAYMDSIPMLVITGQVATSMIGTDAFQETDILGMTLGIVKHSYLVDDAEALPVIIEEAVQLAQSGRPGPVWIDIPKDVLLTEVATASPATTPTPDAHCPDITRALAMLRSARRPLLYSGGGVSLAQAEDSFRAFAETSGLPGVVTLKGIGNAGKHNPHNLGMLGMHGSRAANRAVDECDLLLVVGARLDDRATGKLEGFAPQGPADPHRRGRLHRSPAAWRPRRARGRAALVRRLVRPTRCEEPAYLVRVVRVLEPVAVAARRDLHDARAVADRRRAVVATRRVQGRRRVW